MVKQELFLRTWTLSDTAAEGQSTRKPHVELVNQHQRVRPVIFISHSLGWLSYSRGKLSICKSSSLPNKTLLEQTLLRSSRNATHGVHRGLSSIFNSTKGVIFLGNPNLSLPVMAAHYLFFLVRDDAAICHLLRPFPRWLITIRNPGLGRIMASYKYWPLKLDGIDIRLLALLAGHPSHDIEVEISHLSIFSTALLKYEALPYVWGSTDNPHTITLRNVFRKVPLL